MCRSVSCKCEHEVTCEGHDERGERVREKEKELKGQKKEGGRRIKSGEKTGEERAESQRKQVKIDRGDRKRGRQEERRE